MCVCARVGVSTRAISGQLISIIPSPSHSCNSFAIVYKLTPDFLSLSDRCCWCPCLRSCVARWCSCFMFLPHVPVCSVFHRSQDHLAHFFNRITHHVICTDHLVPVLPVLCVSWNIHLFVYHIKNWVFLHLASIILCRDRTIWPPMEAARAPSSLEEFVGSSINGWTNRRKTSMIRRGQSRHW